MPDELFRTPSGYNKHGQIAVLQDGRVIAFGKNYIDADTLFANGSTCQLINVRVPDLRMIEYVLNVQFDFIPTGNFSCGDQLTVFGKKISGNIVGMTLSGDTEMTGVTLTVEVIAIGPP